MVKATEVAGDVVTASSAVSGLILVYIGSLSASFATFQPTERRSILGSYRRRAWFAFVGLVFFLVAVGLALIGKWLDVECMIVSAIMLLLLGLVWLVITAVLTVLEIG